MKTIALGAGALIILAVIGHDFIPLEQTHPIYPDDSLRTDFKDIESQLSNLGIQLEKYEKDHEERFNQSIVRQQRMSGVIEELKKRLTSLEASTNNRFLDSDSNSGGDKEFEEKLPITATEPDILRWMDNSLALEVQDSIASEQANIEITANLNEKLPGVNLDRIQCGEGFCGATFSQVNGDYPDIRNLVGLPPLVNEIVTRKGENGQLLVYFTETGVSLDDLMARVDENG